MIINSYRKIIVPHTTAIPRAGEGSTVRLNDGNILLVYSQFRGAGMDHDIAELFGGILDINTGKINEGKVFSPSKTALNQMSVSLERLQDGSIGMVFCQKQDRDHSTILFSRSLDEGKSWMDPVNISNCTKANYLVVNNDRLRQFSSGRIAVPACLYADALITNIPSKLVIIYSDDYGKTWSVTEPISPSSNPILPHRMDTNNEWGNLSASLFREQEPGVEELKDGRILYYCRSMIGYMYYAYSKDGGITWGELQAAADIVAPNSPQSIRRIPDSSRLICVYNNRRKVAFGDKVNHWDWRTPLSLAVSDDNGASWQNVANIEDDSHNYCYTSILFIGGEILLTYYESENYLNGSRRNLANLKMQILTIPLRFS
jgi:Neuraminidase (sialidase)